MKSLILSMALFIGLQAPIFAQKANPFNVEKFEKRNKIKNLIITKGKDGVVLYKSNLKPISCPATTVGLEIIIIL